jgi:hypothetical protein
MIPNFLRTRVIIGVVLPSGEPQALPVFGVTGGRDYDNRSVVFDALDRVWRRFGPFVVVTGVCRIHRKVVPWSNPDLHAALWGLKSGMVVRPFPADWAQEGKRAGFNRNAVMAQYGGLTGLLAFPGGRGTADMRAQAAARNIPVWRVGKERFLW